MYSQTRGGTRGGAAEFKWSDVGADKDREHYLGHSINAPTGRWQKNKDVHWYNRDSKDSEEARAEEIRKIKEAEEDAIAAALGFAPVKRVSTAEEASSSNAPTKSPEEKEAEKEEKRRRKEEKRLRKEEKRERKEPVAGMQTVIIVDLHQRPGHEVLPLAEITIDCIGRHLLTPGIARLIMNSKAIAADQQDQPITPGVEVGLAPRLHVLEVGMILTTAGSPTVGMNDIVENDCFYPGLSYQNLSGSRSASNSSSQSSPSNMDAYLTTSTASSSQHVPFEPSKLWSSARPKNEKKPGETKIFYDVDSKGALGAVVSTGKVAEKKGATEGEKREAIRAAVAEGIKKLKDAGATNVGINVEGIDAQAAAEGAALGLFNFTLKTKKEDKGDKTVKFEPLGATESARWEEGLTVSYAQNLARELMELPANMMTPTLFCERMQKELDGVANVETFVRDEAWAAEKGMRTFLSVTKGTSEPAKFLEIHYKGAADKSATPLVLVGKGITFDSGGISLKPSADMKLMRGDMGGAATVCATAVAIAKLKIPINLVVVTPLCENLPGPSANKPGDVVVTMNNKTVEIDNTDAEGRLVLSDAIYYATSTYKPNTVIDVATLTGAMVIALGSVYSGVFTNSDALWSELNEAGQYSWDRFWRMPLDDDGFGPQIYGSNADLCNTGGRPGGSCTAALFLRHFVDGIDNEDATIRWAHIDIAGTMDVTRPGPYQQKGMTGRPVRAFVEFAKKLSAQ
ncbi:hypothetical protein FRC04_006234 [Tulasnella sp. 424]|nr:hypothetical protein FRC04_006234 [Tulasnella sp. 424]